MTKKSRIRKILLRSLKKYIHSVDFTSNRLCGICINSKFTEWSAMVNKALTKGASFRHIKTFKKFNTDRY